jgi:hypothetical protein
MGRALDTETYALPARVIEAGLVSSDFARSLPNGRGLVR